MYTKAYKSNIYCLIYLKLIDLYTLYDLKKYYYILMSNILTYLTKKKVDLKIFNDIGSNSN